MAINNPKPSVDYSLFFDGLGRASLAFVPKCCDNAFLPAKGAAASIENSDLRRAAKGSKRRISKTSQCIKTIHFLGPFFKHQPIGHFQPKTQPVSATKVGGGCIPDLKHSQVRWVRSLEEPRNLHAQTSARKEPAGFGDLKLRT